MSQSSKNQPKNNAAVRVVCRVRPLNEKEKGITDGRCINITIPDRIESIGTRQNENFTFDHVFDENSSQAEVFENVARPIVAEVMRGYNGTVFAYGQTSSGKTHTMEGPDIHDSQLQGIIPRTVDEIFRVVDDAEDTWEFAVKCSYIEIYMEKIRDLLDTFQTRVNLQVREDIQRGIYISGATEQYVTSARELLKIMESGKANRAVAATGMNSGSSRSHSVFIITISQRNSETSSIKTGMLYLVDLAGSEMVKKTQASGQTLEEAKTINKSLSALGLVINALTDEKATHVPYRDSKLTRVLQNSLGGNSKTCLIINCSPSTYNADETASTLRFGSRAKKIKNNAVVNETRSITELSALLVKAENALELQRGYIAALESQLKQDGKIPTSRPSGLTPMESTENNGDITTGSNALQQLHDKITRLEERAQEDEEESARRCREIQRLVSLLHEGEARAAALTLAHNAERERADNLEKSLAFQVDATAKAESEARTSNALVSRTAFELAEAKITIETLTAERERLTNELQRVSGDETASIYWHSPSERSESRSTSISNDQDQDWNMPPTPPTDRIDNGLAELNDRSQYIEKTVYQKRIKEQEKQKATLVADLEKSSARVNDLERKLLNKESLSPTRLSVANSNEYHALAERNKKMTQRLGQIIAVHKQLLRQFNAVEAESKMKDEKLELFSREIAELTDNEEMLRNKMDEMSVSYTEDLSKLRSELGTLRTQYLTFKEEQATRSDYLPGERRVIRGGNSDRALLEVKSIRGGRLSGASEVGPKSPTNFLSRLFLPKPPTKSPPMSFSSTEQAVESAAQVPS